LISYIIELWGGGFIWTCCATRATQERYNAPVSELRKTGGKLGTDGGVHP